ncbi:MAG: hypothetical protein ACOX3E_15170 [Desulfomonilia bacterium]|uniref:Uncharacterized protein n=1 Tax=anaerobic digester metagenome TaxID=1263854 RepID=A0A485M4T6_9ZZZZ|nr:hypothetical protein [Pseudomonadota bacterium]HPD21835.1 hypothetical protein [Deltaproteobacteria bacterium]HPX17906.1 hypothetical protein [Deltaproteobacteria bacterium]HRS55931.1 hypothetical protein [Desulfomonilia bacterium]HRV35643.1 hypothetical protein [Desulfomonilia bacterium]
MKIDTGILALFASPLIALLAGIVMLLFTSGHTPYVPDRPEFLAYIDQLGFSSQESTPPGSAESIRNVFSPGIPGEENSSQGPEAIAPVFVSMIVENGTKSFCVINGKKMQVGDNTGTFVVKAIKKDAITIRYRSGIEETIHVKVY